MSSGSAGKVYFVLYLAVVLELLIIIVDRDDAENGLRKQTREIQQIVQQILASLQTSGAQITTTPQDEIVIDPTARNKQNEEKTYKITVNVGDTTRVHGVTGFMINNLMYTLSYQKDTSQNSHADTGNLQENLPVAYRNGSEPSPINIVDDSVDYPNIKDYEHQKQVFYVHFKPDQPGLYRLRFKANTNQIIGVDLDPNHYRDITDPARLQQTVRIGSVPLSVKQLLTVYKSLAAEPSPTAAAKTPAQAGVDDSTRLKLKNFIGKLLFGQASSLESNNGEIQFDVVVRRLEVPPSAKLDVSPQVKRIDEFAGIPIPDLIKTNVKLIKFDQPQFGNFYMTPDSTWYWSWQPSLADTGKTFTVTYTAHANRNAGPLDNATDTIQVHVGKLIPTEPLFFKPGFYSSSKVIPIGDSITFNRRYKDLEGLYRYQLKIGSFIKEETGQDLHIVIDDKYMGQTAQLIVAFKTKEMTDYLSLDSAKYTIVPRALMGSPANTTIQAGQPFELDLGQGLSPLIDLPAGTMIKVTDNQGGKFFNKEIPIAGRHLIIPMNSGVNVPSPTPVELTFHSNIPNQLDDNEDIVIIPRPRKR